MTHIETAATGLSYLPGGSEERLFEVACARNTPLLLLGPTGCGKTQLVEHMAERERRALITVTCHDDMTTADLVGRHLIRGGDVEWQDGPLTTAMRTGAICYLDEIVEARSDTLAVLHSVADHRRTLFIDRLGEDLRAAEGFLLVASYNPRALHSPKQLKPSLRQRFATIRMAYLPAEREVDVVVARSGVSRGVAEVLVGVAATLRDAAQRDQLGRFDPPSTRTLVQAAHLVEGGATPQEAIKIGIVGPLSADETVELALLEIAEAAVAADGGAATA